MRRFGLHAVVALAGAVACSRFGADTSEAAPATSDGGGGAVGDGADAAGATTDGGPTVTGRFCDQHPKALFCADFEEEGAPTWDRLEAPQGNGSFKRSVGTTDGRKALRLEATNVTTTIDTDVGGFRLPIDPSLTSAKLDLDIMCETTDFEFARLAGFIFQGKDFRRQTSLNLFGYTDTGNAEFGLASAEKGELQLRVVPDRTWAHATISLARNANDELVVQHAIDAVDLGAPIKMSVKETKDGTLLLAFGIQETSTKNSSELVVWFDDVVLTEP